MFSIWFHLAVWIFVMFTSTSIFATTINKYKDNVPVQKKTGIIQETVKEFAPTPEKVEKLKNLKTALIPSDIYNDLKKDYKKAINKKVKKNKK